MALFICHWGAHFLSTICYIFILPKTILTQHNIKVPSPEDDEREPDNNTALYGSIYSDLLDSVEDKLIEILERHTLNTKVIRDEFSGTV